MMPLNAAKVYLLTKDKFYLYHDNDENSRQIKIDFKNTFKDTFLLGEFEEFSALKLISGKYLLCNYNDNNSLNATSNYIGPWQRFKINKINNKYTIQNNKGDYLFYNNLKNKLEFTKKSISENCFFYIEYLL